MEELQPILLSTALFLATSLYFVRIERLDADRDKYGTNYATPNWKKKRETLSPLKRLSKENVSALRSRYFSKAVSVSYSNSGALMIVKGKGSMLMDDSGRWYLDTRNNVAHVGHCNENVVRAVQEQVATLNTNTRYLHANASVLAERLIGKLVKPLEVVFFVNSGSEANDLALRLARAFTKSKNTIVVDGGYHGHTLSCLEVSPYKYEHSKEFDLGGDSRSPGEHVFKVPCPDIYRGPHRDATSAGADYAEYVKDGCQYYRQKQDKVGAFIVEGGMSVGGVILPPTGYLEASVGAVREAGGVYIADEVQTGFGRLGECYWAFQHSFDKSTESSVVPDIVTVGKPFGNGMPLAAVITTRKISDAFESMGVEYFNTFGGNPVCSAAGLAMLDAMDSENLQQNAAKVGKYFKSQFLILRATTLDIIGDVRGSGLFLGIELVRNKMTLEPATIETSFLCTVLKEKYAILTSIDGPCNNVLVVKPPLVFSMDDADFFIESFEKAVLNDLAKVKDIQSLSMTPT